MTTETPTKDRLALALLEIGLKDLADEAARGMFDGCVPVGRVRA